MTRMTALFTIAVFTLAACSGDSTGPGSPSPLEGLQQSTARDSTGTPPPVHPATGSGQIRGTVLAPSNGGGNDTLATAPRIVGAAVTVYPVTGTNPLTLGPEAASVTTGNDGKFTLPTLPAGEYVITVEPPASQGATYHGQWIRGFIHDESGEHPWWVVLAKK